MRKTTKIIIVSLILAIILLGIGYAAIQNITLNITGTAAADPSQSNFKVMFTGTPDISDATLASAAITDDTNATINVSGLQTKGDSVSVIYTIENNSTDLSADLCVSTTNSNTEYFTITSIVGKTSLLSGETTTVTVEVGLTKTPLAGTVTSTIGVQLEVIPVQPGEEGVLSNGTEETNGNDGNNISGIIPSGSTYYVGVTSTVLGDYTGATEIYTEGQTFPETITFGDVYVSGDYEYRYNQYYYYSYWSKKEEQNGWGVCVLYKTKDSYGVIKETINNQPIRSLDYTFYNCKNMTIVPVLPSEVISMNSTFCGCNSITIAPIIPNGVTNMDYAFVGCALETYQGSIDEKGDFSNYIIPNSVKEMRSTFQNCKFITIAPEIPNGVTTLLGTFTSCESLITASVIPSTVTNMTRTFQHCKALINSPDMSEATSITNMDQTFYGCTSLVTAPDLNNCTQLLEMQDTFSYCENLEIAPTLPSNVTTLNSTFLKCKSLKSYSGSVDSDGDFSNYIMPESLTSMRGTFWNCESLVTAPIIPNNVVDMSQTFEDCTSLVNVPRLSDNVQCLENTFWGCTSLETFPVIPQKVKYMDYMFYDCINLSGTIEINAKSLESWSYCFYGTKKPIILTGSCDRLSEIAKTGNGNITTQ